MTDVPMDALLTGGTGKLCHHPTTSVLINLLPADLVSVESADLDSMLDNERVIESIPDPAKMDAQGAAAVYHVSQDILGEGQSVADVSKTVHTLASPAPKTATASKQGAVGVEYKISIATGPQADAGTKSTVQIEIVGSAGGSGRRVLAKVLRSSSNTKVTVTGADVGVVTGIHLHNPHKDSWYCTGVDVTKVGDTSPEKFAVSAWIGAPYQPSRFVVKDVSYELSIKTGSEAGAGTVGKQFVTLFGEYSATKKIELRAGTESGFQSGTLKKITLSSKDVGPIQRIHLETSSADYWLCDTMNIKSGGNVYTFSVNKWVGFPSATLISLGANAKYIVRIKTGLKSDKTLGDAGTKGQIYITIMGSSGTTRKRPLSKDLMAGKESQVVIRARDIGTIQQIKLSTESKDAWLCDSIQIQKGETNSFFSVDRWVGAPAMTPLVALKDAEYEINVTTGRMDAADTKGEVFITMFGSRGATRKKVLSAKGFKKGKFSAVVRARDVGVLTKVRLDSASTDNWFCESVHVSTAGSTARFMIQSWLVSPQAAFVEKAVSIKYVFSVMTGMDLNAPTVSKPLATLFGSRGETHKFALKGQFNMGKVDVVAVWAADVGSPTRLKLESVSKDDWLCQRVTVSSQGRTSKFEVRSWLKSPTLPVATIAAATKYIITVRTGAGVKAGTRDTIYVTMVGSRGQVTRRPLKTGFLAGTTSQVEIDAVNVGSVSKIVLTALSATDDWYCEYVSVTNKADETEASFFSVHRWLGARAIPTVSVEKDIAYMLSWETAPTKSAGTIGKPVVTLYGTSGATKPLALTGEIAIGRKGCEKVLARNIGVVQAIRIENESNDSWIVKSMKVEKANAKAVLFHLGKPIGRATPVTVQASVALAYKDKAKHKAKKPLPHTKNSLEYMVAVSTGDKHNAETSGHQYIALVGSNGQTKNLLLGEKFSRGQTTTMKLKASDVGKISAIKLSTDSRDGWFCSSIQVTQGDQKAAFSVNSWLNSDHEMLPYVQVPLDVDYEVSVETGKGKGADTKGIPVMSIFGDAGSTGALEMKKLSGAAAGSKITMEISARDVGVLKRIRFTMGSKDNWECAKVVISKKLPGAKPVMFVIKKWLGAPRMPFVEAMRMRDYVLVVKTGTRGDADSKGAFFITMYGRDGATRMHELKKGFKKPKKETRSDLNLGPNSPPNSPPPLPISSIYLSTPSCHPSHLSLSP